MLKSIIAAIGIFFVGLFGMHHQALAPPPSAQSATAVAATDESRAGVQE